MKMVHQEYDEETYHCRSCKSEDISHEEIEDWKCKKCGDRVLIKFPFSRNYFIRKSPEEIVEDEDVLLWGNGKAELHEVLKVVSRDAKNSSCSLNLKGFGNYKFKDKWVNIMWDNNEKV